VSVITWIIGSGDLTPFDFVRAAAIAAVGAALVVLVDIVQHPHRRDGQS
jgi:hypothetical protein